MLQFKGSRGLCCSSVQNTFPIQKKRWQPGMGLHCVLSSSSFLQFLALRLLSSPLYNILPSSPFIVWQQMNVVSKILAGQSPSYVWGEGCFQDTVLSLSTLQSLLRGLAHIPCNPTLALAPAPALCNEERRWSWKCGPREVISPSGMPLYCLSTPAICGIVGMGSSERCPGGRQDVIMSVTPDKEAEAERSQIHS